MFRCVNPCITVTSPFSCADGGVWSEPVQPLVGRRMLTMPQIQDDLSLQQQQMEGKRIPPYEAFDEKNRNCLMTGLHGMTTACLNLRLTHFPFVNALMVMLPG